MLDVPPPQPTVSAEFATYHSAPWNRVQSFSFGGKHITVTTPPFSWVSRAVCMPSGYHDDDGPSNHQDSGTFTVTVLPTQMAT